MMDVNCFQTGLDSKPEHSIMKKSTKKGPAHVSRACLCKKALDATIKTTDTLRPQTMIAST
jgi:hypothetical protein